MRPKNISVTMYNVGFGDCFLLTFIYSNEKRRHVLIDCGSFNKRKDHMLRIVNEIAKDCDGHVDAVVATHRHKDHISGFGLKGVGEKLESLAPEVVVQPWTEHPDADLAAIEAPGVFDRAAINHLMSLTSAQIFAKRLIEKPTRALTAFGLQEQRYLTNLASLSIPNKRAVIRLSEMGKRHAYVYAEGPSGMEELFPGVRISILGPPTLKQSKEIEHQTRWNDAEFWKLYAKLTAVAKSNVKTAKGHSKLFPNSLTDSIAKSPSYVKWVIQKVDDAQKHNIRRIVRILDDALNNTSVILLFEIGEKRLLFPGDAQLENWQYALSNYHTRRRLQKTLIYKVGHHGSTNATPKSLWKLFKHRSDVNSRLIALLSTKSGHHHRVPRKSLVSALENEALLFTTQRWGTKLKETCTI